MAKSVVRDIGRMTYRPTDFFLFFFIPVDLDYMALQNRVGLGRETFSFQLHFEKKVKLAQNAELQKKIIFFFQKLPENFGVKYGWSGRLIGNKGIFA